MNSCWASGSVFFVVGVCFFSFWFSIGKMEAFCNTSTRKLGRKRIGKNVATRYVEKKKKKK
jgi:hypothetical protein